jgi:phosphoglycolate phosphatase-like HAD superfamily hydrolase
VSSRLLVLFDVDGTLFLTHDEIYVQANRDALREVYGVTDVEHPDDPGDTALHYTRLVLEKAGVDEATIDTGLAHWCDAISRRYVELLECADTSAWRKGTGANETLAEIPHKALLTGNPEPIARARMDCLGLARFFPPGEGAFGCERERRVELIDLALRRAGDWPPSEAVAVGDTPRDIRSAHAAGLRCIAVTSGAYRRKQLDADQVISSLAELPDALASLD